MPSNLKEIVEGLAEMAADNRERAYRVLGARPGPGVDLLIKPATEPMNNKWLVIGQTMCGKLFVKKFWIDQPLSNQKLAEMKKQAHEWEIKYSTHYPIERL